MVIFLFTNWVHIGKGQTLGGGRVGRARLGGDTRSLHRKSGKRQGEEEIRRDKRGTETEKMGQGGGQEHFKRCRVM